MTGVADGGGPAAYRGGLAGPHDAPQPAWVGGIVEAAARLEPTYFSRYLPPDEGSVESAVLVLFGPGADGEPSLLLIERAHTLRSHAGQIAFPGGRVDPEDVDVVGAALREAHEEVGLAPESVTVVGTLPALFIPVSSYAVTPVVAWWHEPGPVAVGHPDEVAQVLSVPVSYLVEPAHRHTVVHPSGYRGPAWELGPDLLLWGFTGGIVDKVLELAGLAQPWDRRREQALPERFLRGRS
ncbi:MAG TPA: CoA pyrophosphatase [Dermatophilaceae bacterium]|nr:CoA pyrophosphatase [Dermatophilaceae bacterium]